MLPVRCLCQPSAQNTRENPVSGRAAENEREAEASHGVRSQAEPVNEGKQ